MDRKTRIAVIGAGLAGLTVAGLLQRSGFSVVVYEQAPAFSRIGAGIILGANAAKVLRRLDVERGMINVGIRPDAFVSRAWDSGETTYELRFDAEIEARFDGPFINIHRADLHQLLLDALEPGSVRLGHEIAGIDETAGGLRLSFANGAVAETDLAIGADGIRSKVRDLILGAEPPRFIGRIAPRAIFPASRIAGTPIRDCTKWWGPDRHVLAYYMTPRRDEIYVMGAVPADRWEGGDTPVRGSREEFVAAFADFHPDLRRAVEAATDVMVWPICDRPRDDRWSAGPVVLMGDACHPVRPFMAAGGSMAIEDAAILSRCLSEFSDPSTAFACYAALRIPRVAEVQRISIDNSWMRGATDIDWFFEYDPWRVPLTARMAAGTQAG
jgi:6-hydroxynicotinate 3-monooxygenase